MLTCREQILTALEAIRIESRVTFSWLGVRSAGLPRELERAMDERTAGEYLHSQVAERLYRSFYSTGGVRPVGDDEQLPLPDVRRDPEFTRPLSAANGGRGSWRGGWRLRVRADDAAIVCRDGLSLRVRDDGYRLASGAELVRGAAVEVRFPREQLGISPGYYMAHGDAGFDCKSPREVLRVYWNVRAAGAALLVKRLTQGLNNRGLSFELKVLHPAVDASRCDRGVLYIRRDDFEKASEEIVSTHAEMRSFLSPRVPVFTHELAPGVSVAENPARGGSFGKHRSMLLAEGILAPSDGRPGSRLKVIEERFAAAGLDLDVPHREPGSDRRYEMPKCTRPSCRVRSVLRSHTRSVSLTRASSVAPEASLPTASAEEVAIELAHRLAREALWHDDRCTWIAPARGPLEGKGSVHATLPPTLYRGNSGLALFLAESAAVARDPDLRETALAAMRQALVQIRGERCEAVTAGAGLYSGSLGVLLCAARVGLRLGEPALVEQAARSVRQLSSIVRDETEFDIILGAAGGILALLALSRLVEAPLCVDLAVDIAEKLEQSAERSERGLSWASPSLRSRRHLTGYSHGTAGVGHALLELFSVTGDSRHRDVAQQAFEYERHEFDARRKNWPDHRQRAESGRRSSRADVSRRFTTTWCHGAPGIALSRIRAFELLKDPICRDEAIVALETTRDSVRRWLERDGVNLCLCHGILGNTEVLQRGETVLSRFAGVDRSLIDEVLNASAARLVDPAGSTEKLVLEHGLGFMTGLAGVGHSLLHLSDPQRTPSLLAITPGTFTLPSECHQEALRETSPASSAPDRRVNHAG